MMEIQFGDLLQKLRKEKGWTQQQLAELLNVTNKTVSKWERNETYPETATLIEISKLFQISVDDLLNGKQQSKEGQTDSDVMHRLEMLNQWQIVKAGLFSKIMIILGMTGFYGLYFYTKKFLPSFSVLACFLIVSFSFLWFKQEKIKVYSGKSNSKESWIKWIACVSAVLILILPCVNFPVNVHSLIQQGMISSAIDDYIIMQGETYVYVHLSFLNYVTWLPYLMIVAMLVCYSLIYLITKKSKKQFKTALMAFFMAVLLILGRNVLLKTLRPFEVMSEQSYQAYKNRYMKLTEAFDVLPADLSNIDADQVNEVFYGKARYEQYLDVVEFSDSKCCVYYQISTKQKETSRYMLLGLVYLVTIGALVLVIKNESEKAG